MQNNNQSKVITIGLSFKQLGQDDMPVQVSSTASIVKNSLSIAFVLHFHLQELWYFAYCTLGPSRKAWEWRSWKM